jgi:uncharacterized phage protein (TIGR02218 family)
MRTAVAALTNLLATGSFIVADLYTITLINSQAYYFTSYDRDLIVGSHAFLSSNLIINRSGIKTVIGYEVDSMKLKVDAGIANLLGGVPFMQVLNNGGLDGARIKLERLFMAAHGDAPPSASDYVILLFSGRVSDVEFTGTEADITVSSDLELLNIQLPRNVWGPNCLNCVYDAACGLSQATWTVSSSVTNAGDLTYIKCGLTQAAQYFDNGGLLFTSGVNNGVLRSVKSYDGSGGGNSKIVFTVPLKSLPSIADTFNIYPGCDLSLSMCINKFNNKSKFRGYPYIPVPETAY